MPYTSFTLSKLFKEILFQMQYVIGKIMSHVFLTSFSHCLLMKYRNTIDFLYVDVYPGTLLIYLFI